MMSGAPSCLGKAILTSISRLTRSTAVRSASSSSSSTIATTAVRAASTSAAGALEDLVYEEKIPRCAKDNYTRAIAKERQNFIEDYTGKKLEHVSKFSFEPERTKGNIENFTGVAQIPMGFAGPLMVNGEHAQGEFVVPLATTEGSLVASYNRGMKVLNMCGGVTCSIVEDAMQRAPVFEFSNAREARDFCSWIQENFEEIAHNAEKTSSVAKLENIDSYLASKFAYLRFNYKTGDAAGQNMVNKATFAACSWIYYKYKSKGIQNFFLESNMATDKKASQINLMKTRGKRVVAEAIISRDVLFQELRAKPEVIVHHGKVGHIGGMMAGATNNGYHAANAIAATFIATGQDVANVAESSAGILYTELTKKKDLYMSLTLPSLIVATHGGGTGLATQRECLELMGCHGKGKVNKFAEIIAGTALAGEISLAAAIPSFEWVSSHEELGRNR